MKLSLPDVSLLAVTSVAVDQTHRALLYSAERIDFGAIKLLSPVRPARTDRRVTYVPIPAIDFLGYSRFVVRSLHEHVSTEHCLIIQADGFVLNPDRWSPEFAQYDYVGAPWPEFVFLQPGNRRFYLNRNRVGNGGFSLRSKRLLEITSRIDFDQLKFPVLSEDLVICHYLYDDMRSAGVRFAPTDVAARFSIESPHGTAGQPLDSTFGFHGKHWFGELVDRLISERTTLQT